MTEGEWLICDDPREMLNILPGNASERKFRLFACACCRRWWTPLPRNCRDAIQMAEADGEGAAQRNELRAIQAELESEGGRFNRDGNPVAGCHPTVTVLWAVQQALGPLQLYEMRGFCAAAFNLSVTFNFRLRTTSANEHTSCDKPFYPNYAAALQGESLILARLLREVIGNPFRPVIVNPCWLTPNVIALAQAIYDGRAFDRLPELAHALVAAGCDNQDILNHCLSDEPHVRGCWVVDLVLGKE